ncbi:rubrerythrin family protein [Halomarina litorea]|uniref:rubrerythrin family protein n=1 Tax=Halomarina litorea TaxID=2961595 RepID=UPI0020C2ABE9|nr:rubrerythrin family protein [Halomarina sp. BCD28]
MNEEEFTATVREECAQELDRLGSEKALVATTAAQLEDDRVLESAAQAEQRAIETFEQWSTTEANTEAQTTFERILGQEQDHYDRIAEHLETVSEADEDELHEYLRGLDDAIERVAAGVVARGMVSSRSLLQTINYFVNESDEATADLFRDIRAETDEQVESGARLLADLCAEDAQWERAQTAAVQTIQLAYEEYAESLEGMGIDPKPVC